MKLKPHHHPLLPVSCSLRMVKGIVANSTIKPVKGVSAILIMKTNNLTHQYSERRARPFVWNILLVAALSASENPNCGSGTICFMALLDWWFFNDVDFLA